MFGFQSIRKPVVIDHWYVLLPDFQISTTEFYKAVEAELLRRKVPGLEIVLVLFPEGNALSARREYLRMRRERLIFEVCSAPFGTSWFFSCRFSEIPLRLRVWDVIIILIALLGVYSVYFVGFGLFWGSIVFSVSLIGFLYLLNSVIPMGMYDLDDRLIRTPIIGPFYEIFLRQNTYFRQDTRLMYCDLVDQVVRSKIEEFTGAKGVSKVEIKRDESMLNFSITDLFRKVVSSLWGGLKKN